MKVLIKQATIVCPSSPFNGFIKDILIEDGIFTSIEDLIDKKADLIIQESNLQVSIGWMDIFADFGDPGFEFRETIESGTKAAATGGFTDVMVIPNTNPVIHTKSQVEYIIRKSETTPVTIHPIGAVTKNAEGNTLSEMYDMHQSGAITFSDGNHPIQSPGILLKALQYVKAINGTIIQVPDDISIGTNGLINEGITSTQLGLPGKPAIAEELMIARDLELVRYTGSNIHFTGVSTQKSIELITKAKLEGLKVTFSVTPYHCFFCDEDLITYDTNLKVNPPLRSKSDRMALQKALSEGVIDCIASHHLPQSQDDKICEFEYAKYGMLGLETVFPVMHSMGCGVPQFVQMQSIHTRKIVGLPIPEIAIGSAAKLTLFNAETAFVYQEANIQSKSKNTPFVGMKLKGKVIGIINNNMVHLNK